MSDWPPQPPFSPSRAALGSIQARVHMAIGATELADQALQSLLGHVVACPPTCWLGTVMRLCVPIDGTVMVKPLPEADHKPWKPNERGEIAMPVFAIVGIEQQT